MGILAFAGCADKAIAISIDEALLTHRAWRTIGTTAIYVGFVAICSLVAT
jgi:hypothetical protein